MSIFSGAIFSGAIYSGAIASGAWKDGCSNGLERGAPPKHVVNLPVREAVSDLCEQPSIQDVQEPAIQDVQEPSIQEPKGLLGSAPGGILWCALISLVGVKRFPSLSWSLILKYSRWYTTLGRSQIRASALHVGPRTWVFHWGLHPSMVHHSAGERKWHMQDSWSECSAYKKPRASVANTRQSRPESGRGFQAEVLQKFEDAPSSPRSRLVVGEYQLRHRLNLIVF